MSSCHVPRILIIGTLYTTTPRFLLLATPCLVKPPARPMSPQRFVNSLTRNHLFTLSLLHFFSPTLPIISPVSLHLYLVGQSDGRRTAAPIGAVGITATLELHPCSRAVFLGQTHVKRTRNRAIPRQVPLSLYLLKILTVNLLILNRLEETLQELTRLESIV